MRQIRAFLAAACVVLAATEAVQAQPRTPIEISRLRIGLPAGPFSSDEDRQDGGYFHVFKPGAWAPVWVDIVAHEEIKEPLELIVETADADNSLTTARVPIAPMQKGERRTAYDLGRIPYLKTASGYPDVSAYVRQVKGERSVSNTMKRSFAARDQNDFLVVSIGASLSGFRLPKLQALDEADPDYRKHRGGAVELAECLEVGQMPDSWIGYSAFDLVILCTGANDKFWSDLKAQPGKQQALLEWVRRGGRVAISSGIFADILADVPMFKDLLPANVPPGGKRAVASLPLLWLGLDKRTQNFPLRDARGNGSVFTIDIAPRADRTYRVLSPPESSRTDAKPAVVQGSYGLGKVTLVCFDVDRPPFSDWEHRAAFWEWLTTEAGGRLPVSEERFRYDRDDPQFNQLNDMLDSFEGVPVISFGWVALFILGYILLIGPVDYLFLKKVVKKLEWTWVTFPLIVIAVSAIAYYAAYAVKGKDQKINKVDFVDVDLQTKRIYGQTWFTIFSPRIQTYNIGVEPAGPEPGGDKDKPWWTPDDAATTAPQTTLTWNSQMRDTGRSLLQRRYRYRSDYSNPDRPTIASGLEEVPIQVWSTKSFTATWSAGLDAKVPLLEHSLHHPPGEPDKLVGGITSHFPVAVQGEIWLLFRDRAIAIDQLTPGVERFVALKDTSQPIPNALGTIADRARGTGPRTDTFGLFRLYGIQFGDRLGLPDRPLANTAVRLFDQSWRVRENNPDHAILLLRLPSTAGSAEDQTNSAATPTRLWLNDVPGGSGARKSIEGTIRQETYVRVFIPVPRSEK